MTRENRTAVICLRLSEDIHKGTDREGEGIARQSEDCHDHTERNSWRVKEVIADNDSSALRRRPGFERLLKIIESGEIDTVVAWSSERLLKTKTDEFRFYETCLKAPRPVVVSYARGMTFDLSTPQGRKFFDNAASDARYETELKSERQRRANRQSAEKGRPPAGPRPFGYEPDRVTLRPAEAKAGDRVYKAVLSGLSLASQARVLNQAGLLTGQGNLWRPETLRTWLLSPRNIGMRALRREIVAKGIWPPLVEETIWHAVKAILDNPARKHRNGRSAKGLLTGVARCGICNETVNMGGITRFGHRTYNCRTGKHVSRDVAAVDALVTAVVIGIIERDGSDLLVDHERPDVDGIRDAMEEIRIRLKQLGADYAAGFIERSTMLDGTEVARRNLTDLETRLTDAGRVDVLGAAVAAEDVSIWWRSNEVSDDHRRRIIDTILDVTILKGVRGRKGFDTSSVRVEPKDRTQPSAQVKVAH